jgi:type II secretory pathway pseudopilin PulG
MIGAVNAESISASRQVYGAFTLVELLVVIGAIALLIAILMPALTAVQSRAQSLKCISNIRQIGVALRLYSVDNKDAYPINVSTPTPEYWNDSARIGRYLALPSIAMDSSSIFWCPADVDAQQSYAMNIWASSAVDRSVTARGNGVLWPHRRAASAMILIAESWSYQRGSGTGYLPTPCIGTYGSSAGQRFGALGGIGPIMAGRWGPVNSELTFARHRDAQHAGAFTQPNGGVSIFFDDGHAALCTQDDLVDPETGTSSGLAAWSPMDYVRN